MDIINDAPIILDFKIIDYNSNVNFRQFRKLLLSSELFNIKNSLNKQHEVLTLNNH